MGTFIYAAPEVMSRPQDADPRADIYGLGMTAVFALFGGDLAMDVIRDADRFIDHLPCNPVIQDVLKKAVAWDRNDRFATAAEFVAALERACELPVAAAGQAVFMPTAVARDEAVAARTSPGGLPRLASAAAPAPVSAGKVMAAAKPVRADAPGWSPAPTSGPSPGLARAGSVSPQENQRKPVVPARTPTHAALPVAASGPVAWASASGSSLSAAAKRALQALEEEDAADDGGFELSVTDSGERSGVYGRVQAGEAGAAVSGADGVSRKV